MKKVALITTGGTIASKYNEDGRLVAGVMTGSELCRMLHLPEHIELEIYSMLQKPSMHITHEDLDRIGEKMNELFQENEVDGIVLTHGTDCLEESAYYLDLTVDIGCPIVVTGSQRSPEDTGSDANTNLRDAICAAADEKLRGIGTVVVFNQQIFSARYVKKIHSSNLQGFGTFGYGYLGIVDNGEVILYQKPIVKEKHLAVSKELPVVDIVKCYQGADDKFIRTCISAGVDGIVLEAAGRGQVTPGMMAAIREAISKGIYVVVTTSSEEGEVYPAYDYLGSAYDLQEAGAILGLDYDSKKARIKLISLIRAGENVRDGFARK